MANSLVDLYVHATTQPGAKPLGEARMRADMKAILDLVTPLNDEDESERNTEKSQDVRDPE